MSFVRRFARNRGAVIGLALLVVLLAFAIIGPYLYPQSPWRVVGRPFLAPFAMERFPLGTDTLGRDIAAGLVHGASVSLTIGVVSTLVALLIGVPLGAIAGYAGGIVDDLLMRFTEFFQTIPSFALAIVLVAILQPTLGSIVLTIGLVSWPPVARLVRGEVLSLKTREYVLAAVTLGQSTSRIIFSQILPNAIAPIVVMGSLMIASAILLESALSFLGLGDPNRMSWGYMIGAGRARLIDAWWISFFPGLAIFLTVLALNLAGEGLNDALNPRLSRGGR
ncbi:ABC transporter permease [Bradyrhizobium sp. NP1]|uniref:ABC transporter permease n=1 Tax=Bradyrhizobium sp. NP1 TaxID=3049772 RepID=UPI0025A68B82|nr:ABC transporter permease [Bradyrhizobium sp. NP1]WJR75743.1 ABC transporter permease [Bradyrhizobium sp. NP1]